MPRIIYVDTVTYIDAMRQPDKGYLRHALSRTDPSEWYASPHTVIELIRKVHLGSQKHFRRNKRPLTLLARTCPTRSQFLPFPGAFTSRLLGGNRQPNPGFAPADVRRWVQIMRGARCKAQLLTTDSRTGNKYFLKMDKLDTELDVGKAHHINRLELVRDQKLAQPDLLTWAHFMAECSLDRKPTEAEVEKVAAGFDAAFHYDNALFQLAKNKIYDFSEHHTDFLDLQQLLYLVNPDAWFITNDKKMIGRVSGSAQAGRVMTLQDLAART